MSALDQPPVPADATASPPVHPLDLAALLKHPYRPGDAAYAAALWHATVQRLAALPIKPPHR